MCGIGGYVAGSKIPGRCLQKMSEIIEYRGPDDHGFAIFDTPQSFPVFNTEEAGCIGLLHRRLSIVDLSPLGHQPMSYKDDRYWITYNGEIYNYVELRKELQALGHQFKSQSDTEVILAAYAQWGADCLHKFNGMWSFAIYDHNKEALFLARDRFGVKPLYYWISPDGVLYFGSEIKQFTVLDGWQASVNAQRAYDFLIWGLIDHTKETMFSGVYHLRPGHYVLLDVHSSFIPAGALETTQWYYLKPHEFSGHFNEGASQFHDLLSDSVRLRLRADVPVGSCLSGGLDSSSIVCLMNQKLGQDAKQKTFSAVSDVEQYNERKWIDEVVVKTGVDDHYIHPTLDNLFDMADKITWHQDEPFGSTSIYAQWNVFELAAKNDVIVMLDGQGADEQLGGYHGFFAPLFYGLFRTGRWIKLIREIRAVKKRHGYSEMRAIEHIVNMMLPDTLKNPLKKILGRNHKSPSWLDVERLGAQPVDPHRVLGSYTHSIQDLCHAQLTASNLQGLLHWEDRNSMAHSIESRVPFLDYRLVEFSLGLPDAFKINDGKTKLVLREAMSGVLPDKIRDRTDKLGFATPEEVWFRQRGTPLFRQKLQEAVNDLNGIITEDVMTYFEEVVSGKKAFNFTLWRIINFAQWIRIFNVQLVR